MRSEIWLAPAAVPVPRPRDYDALLELARVGAASGALWLKESRAEEKRFAFLFGAGRVAWPLREARALCALRTAGIPAAEPLLAGARRQAGAREGFLATARVHDARDLERGFLSGDALDTMLGRQLGLLVARLHTGRFVHRDLFLRNVLVTPSGLLLIDVRRSYRERISWWGRARGRAYDLACLDADLRLLAPPAFRAAFWAAYLSAAPALPSAGRREGTLARHRRGLLRRFRSRRPEARKAYLERLGLSEAELVRRWQDG